MYESPWHDDILSRRRDATPGDTRSGGVPPGTWHPVLAHPPCSAGRLKSVDASLGQPPAVIDPLPAEPEFADPALATEAEPACALLPEPALPPLDAPPAPPAALA